LKISEKSLELNVGAELLGLLRGAWGMPKAYLRGLTQLEEKQEGVDFFVQLDPATRVFAFQFKAPRGKTESMPYRYTIVKEQHELLFGLSQLSPSSVFYVFPFYVTPVKLQQDVPQLLQDTWLLQISQMPTSQIFGSTKQTRTILCHPGNAVINPEYKLEKLTEASRLDTNGISIRRFGSWYRRNIVLYEPPETVGRRNPRLVRGLRPAIVTP
jgi:hypothetical protein